MAKKMKTILTIFLALIFLIAIRLNPFKCELMSDDTFIDKYIFIFADVLKSWKHILYALTAVGVLLILKIIGGKLIDRMFKEKD